MKRLILPGFLIWFVSIALATDVPPWADIVVDQSNEADFKTLTEAIKTLPMYSYQRVVIFLRNGIYNERVRLTQNYVTLRGENRDSTIIRYPLLRSEWDKNQDHIGPGVLNIFADDVILENLTIENSQPEIGPHAFAVYGKSSRIIILNCNIYSKGADTVALW
ncbi:pectinesterase family protein, partial [Calditrichota bacterium]